MAGARPSTYKKAGGFLNNVDGKIVGYEFTDEFNGQPFVPGKVKGKDKFHSLYFVVQVQLDGADDIETTTLFVGGADDFEIENDGHTLTPLEDGFGLSNRSGLALFINSLVAAGFDENLLPEDEINFEAIIGARVRFVQVLNEEATKKLGKRKDKKTGKEYDRNDLQIAAYYGQEDVKAGKAKGKTTTVAKGKKAQANDDDVDLETLADETLLAVLAEVDGPIGRLKLPPKIALNLGPKHAQRTAIQKLVNSQDYLAGAEERGIIRYNAKTQMIEAAA